MLQRAKRGAAIIASSRHRRRRCSRASRKIAVTLRSSNSKRLRSSSCSSDTTRLTVTSTMTENQRGNPDGDLEEYFHFKCSRRSADAIHFKLPCLKRRGYGWYMEQSSIK